MERVSEGGDGWQRLARRWLAVLGTVVLALVAVISLWDAGEASAALLTRTVVALAIAVPLWVLCVLRTVDRRVQVVLFVLLGIVGIVPPGVGYLISYLGLAGLALRLPLRRSAPLAAGVLALYTVVHSVAGGMVVLEAAITLCGGAAVFMIAAIAAVSQQAQERAERLLRLEAATREARGQAAALRDRSVLAREIHDIVAHTFAGLAVQLEIAKVLAEQTGADPRLADQLAHAHQLTRSGIVEARRAVSALRGGELPGPALLPTLVATTAQATGVRIGYEVIGAPGRLVPEVGLALYRTAQEALTNTVKHAGPGATARIEVRWEDHAVRLTATDTRPDGGDGTLAPFPQAGTGHGYGLTGMAERAELLGGHLDAGPWRDGTGGGFRVELRLPIATAGTLADGGLGLAG